MRFLVVATVLTTMTNNIYQIGKFDMRHTLIAHCADIYIIYIDSIFLGGNFVGEDKLLKTIGYLFIIFLTYTFYKQQKGKRIVNIKLNTFLVAVVVVEYIN